MTSRERAGLICLVALTLAAPLVALAVVRRGIPEAHAARDPFAALRTDSAVADSSAFEALPVALRPLLDVRSAIDAAAADTLSLHECIQMDGRAPEELRRRLQLRFADSSAAVLYAIADRRSGMLSRVEYLRRTPRAGQRGFIWDAQRDRTTSVWWFETARGLSRRGERGELPRGGPVPRAIRALARQLLVVPCADSSTNSPMNPISGSRD